VGRCDEARPGEDEMQSIPMKRGPGLAAAHRPRGGSAGPLRAAGRGPAG